MIFVPIEFQQVYLVVGCLEVGRVWILAVSYDSSLVNW